jgi:ABC-type antimicrobial peptide transport system permease subunit
VIDDMKYAGLTAEGRPAWYVPHAQAAESIDGVARTITVTLRTAGDPVALSPALRRVVRELDPDLPITGLRSMNDVLAASVARPRFTMSLMILFAGLALTLGAVGIYGVISYTVARRTQELGIRMALGAEPGRLARKVVGEGARLTMVGLIVGAIGAAAGTRLLSALLFGVSAMDPTTFIVAAALLTGVALIASWVPARRATRIDPAIALRRE